MISLLHSDGRSARIILPLLLIALAPSLAWPIQTQRVEIGAGGAYDGTVQITRDNQGHMLLRDAEVTTVSLGDLRFSGHDHGLLIGLSDDDHPQYLNASRHNAAHNNASFNGFMATPADVRGNVTLGAHLQDSTLHLRRDANETVSGAWIFSSAVQFFDLLSGGLSLSSTAAPATALSIRRKDSTQTNPMAAIGMLGGGTNNNQGIITFSTINSGAPDAPLVERARIHTNGFFGVGTSTPVAMLHIGNLAGTGAATAIALGKNSGPTYVHKIDCGISSANESGNYLAFNLTRFGGGNNEVMRLVGEGKVGIGTPSPATALDVAGVINAQAGLQVGGQRLMNEINLLDNPNFAIWQRGTIETCIHGGNAAGTLTYPQPGVHTSACDRWQITRAKTDMIASLARATPPGVLPTAANCLRLEAGAGNPNCTFYLHQTVSRPQTACLRGKWVTFAVSHYLEDGTAGATIAIYKTVGGAPAELARFSFASVASVWERVAVAAQVPADAETILVSIQPNLSPSGPRVAYVANAVLIEGKYVNTTEKAASLAESSVPPFAKSPAADLTNCQYYFERGAFDFSAYSPNNQLHHYFTSIHYNTPKSNSSAIAIGNLIADPLTSVDLYTLEKPTYSTTGDFPQGFMLQIGGTTSAAAPVMISGNWTATCPEPL